MRAIAATLLLLATGVTSAQTYPSKPIRFIIPYPPGGVTDPIARAVAQKMSEALGQQVVLDQRGGGASIVGTELAAKAAPDGYTLLLGTFGFAVTPALHARLPYDTLRDFAAISLVARGLLALVVHPALPIHSVRDLIAAAKARPEQINFGSTGGGSSSNLGALLFQSLTGTHMTGISYKGGGPSMTALLGGEINLIFSSLSPTLPHVRSGRLRALGVSSAKRTSALPDVPTIAEGGVPGYEVISWYGVLAPRRTPAHIVRLLNSVIVPAIKSAPVQERLVALGVEPAFSTPEELSRYVAAEMAKWSAVVRQLSASHD